MLISHEVPIAYLETSKVFNDYDYCLVHLCDKHPEYLEFYKRSVQFGREVLLDNSIFELGTAYDGDRFADRIVEIKPTYYVVPDALENAHQTMLQFDEFVEDYGSLPGLKIGVVQGKNYTELLDCYRFMAAKADYIALSFDMSYYSVATYGKTKLEQQCMGRYEFIKKLVETGEWENTKPHHLLGCSLAREFSYYTNLRGIRSVDTSNPIVAALDGKRYIRNIGLTDKSPVKLADQILAPYDLDTESLMHYNAADFREIAHS